MPRLLSGILPNFCFLGSDGISHDRRADVKRSLLVDVCNRGGEEEKKSLSVVELDRRQDFV